MLRPYSISLFGLLLVLSCVAAGCSSVDASGVSDDDDDDDTTTPTGLQVSPAGPLTLGFGEEQVFQVVLLDQEGQPMVGEPVQVSLVGPAHNGYVSPFEFVTDEGGAGDVTFKAPEKVTELEVRFSSPAAPGDVSIDVSVSSSALGLTVELDYAGVRNLVVFAVEVHDGIDCGQLGQASDPEPVAIQTADAVPTTLWFGGLLADHEYAVLARGYNAAGTVRAGACVDGLLAGAPAVNIVPEDQPYLLAGVFAVSAVADTGGDLAPAVQSLGASLDPFTADVPGAILDAIRAGQDLDGFVAQDLEDREVDVAYELEQLWDGVETRLAAIGFSTRLEIGAVTDGVHALYHTVEQLSFDGVDAPYPVVLQDQGQGTATISATDPDLLLIGSHSVGLGLGGPLVHVMGAELAAGFGVAGLAEALTVMVDCEAVAAVLLAPLAEVADPVAIHAGCTAAMAAAGAELDARQALLDSTYSQLGLSGSCRLADPGIGNQVAVLADGILSMVWGGVESLGPMASTFSGQIE